MFKTGDIAERCVNKMLKWRVRLEFDCQFLLRCKMSNSPRMSARIREARENRRVSLGVGLTSRENPETSNASRRASTASVNTNVTTTARASTSRNNPVPRNTTSGINRRTAASQGNPVARNTSTGNTRRTSTAATALPQIRITSGRSAATSTLPRATSTPRRPALTGARSRLATIRSSPTSEVPRSSVKKNEKKRADKQVQTEKSDEVFSLPITKRDRSLSPTQLPCAVCFNELLPSAGRRLTSLECGHTFCRPCVDKWYEICKFCPLCMQPMNKKSFRNIFF
ncbi:uncharacterized protein isoform X2 [Rhodnius prolixus]|uniref:uncharacterized protein isoform X2 n=2 Tax=Rhodnius prolixus TaxID=13249 RepID=UPI003D18B155